MTIIDDGVARIGPNAIIRVAEALDAQLDGATKRAVFERAGLQHYLETLPSAMVDEREVIALHGALRLLLEPATVGAVTYDAGLRTGDYLLAHRIPRFAQHLLRLLPPAPACRMLLTAVGRNAWTFSGSGVYSFAPGRPVRVRIGDCPICRGAQASAPVCHYYTGAFARLCQKLVSARAQVREIQCQAVDADACVFEIDW